MHFTLTKTSILLLCLMYGLAFVMFAVREAKADDFASGKAFAQGSLGGTAGKVTGGNAAQVPGYNTTPPERGLFGGAGVFAPAASKISGCAASNPGYSGNLGAQECEAVNFLAKNPAQRVQFNINKAAEPALLAGRQIVANAKLTSGVSDPTKDGCGTRDVVTAGGVTTEVCNEFSGIEQNVCNKTLGLVKIDRLSYTRNESCTYTTWYNYHCVAMCWSIGDSNYVYAGDAQFSATSPVGCGGNPCGGMWGFWSGGVHSTTTVPNCTSIPCPGFVYSVATTSYTNPVTGITTVSVQSTPSEGAGIGQCGAAQPGGDGTCPPGYTTNGAQCTQNSSIPDGCTFTDVGVSVIGAHDATLRRYTCKSWDNQCALLEARAQ